MKYMLDVHYRIREEYFGGLALNVDTLTYYELNEQSIRILELLSQGNDSSDISSILASSYKVNEDEIKQDIDNFIKQSLENGLISEYNSKSNKNLIIKSQFKDLEIISPIEVYVYLTNKCNQRCYFCYNHSKVKDEFTKDEVFDIVDQAKELGVFTIGVLGGEPLIRKDLLLQMFDRCGNDIHKVITTNASCDGGIDKEFAEKLSKYKSLEVNVSLQGSNSELHDKIVGYDGAFESVISSIKRLVDYNITVGVKTVALKSNRDEIINIVRLVKKLGVNSFNLLYDMPNKYQTIEQYYSEALVNEDYHNLAESIVKEETDDFRILVNYSYLFIDNDKYMPRNDTPITYSISTCSAGRINMEILPNGDVYPCSMSVGDEDFKIGNVKNTSLKEVWTSKNFNVYRKRDIGLLENSECIKCEYKEKCGGGCPIVSKYFSNSIYGGDIRCPKVLNKLLLKSK